MFSGYTQVYNTATMAGRTDETIPTMALQANCPRPYSIWVLGGGYSVHRTGEPDSVPDVRVTTSAPIAYQRGWKVVLRNNDRAEVTVTVLALCANTMP